MTTTRGRSSGPSPARRLHQPQLALGLSTVVALAAIALAVAPASAGLAATIHTSDRTGTIVDAAAYLHPEDVYLTSAPCQPDGTQLAPGDYYFVTASSDGTLLSTDPIFERRFHVGPNGWITSTSGDHTANAIACPNAVGLTLQLEPFAAAQPGASYQVRVATATSVDTCVNQGDSAGFCSTAAYAARAFEIGACPGASAGGPSATPSPSAGAATSAPTYPAGPTGSPTATPNPTPCPTPTGTASASQTSAPTTSATVPPSPSSTPGSSPSSAPVGTPLPSPTAGQTAATSPTPVPTPTPTPRPTPVPTAVPTATSRPGPVSTGTPPPPPVVVRPTATSKPYVLPSGFFDCPGMVVTPTGCETEAQAQKTPPHTMPPLITGGGGRAGGGTSGGGNAGGAGGAGQGVPQPGTVVPSGSVVPGTTPQGSVPSGFPQASGFPGASGPIESSAPSLVAGAASGSPAGSGDVAVIPPAGAPNDGGPAASTVEPGQAGDASAPVTPPSTTADRNYGIVVIGLGLLIVLLVGWVMRMVVLRRAAARR